MRKYHVLISCLHLQRTIDQYNHRFLEHGISIEMPKIDQQLSEDQLLEIIERFDGVIAGDDQFTAKVLQNGKKLKIISKWGVGIDGIDINEANRLGIMVTNTPAVFSEEVADVVIGYLILLSRQLHIIDRNVRNGEWNGTQIQGLSLQGKTLGIIGVGNIGKAVAKRGMALGMNLIGYDLYPLPDDFQKEVNIAMMDINQVYSQSDFLSLNCNLTEQNNHMLNKEAFSLMKKGIFIINTSRGQLIDENELCLALQSEIVAGVALDVFEKEPLPEESQLRKYSNCIFGCHNSSNTKEAVIRVNNLAIQNLFDGLN